MLGFEFVIVVAAALGIPFARGAFREAPGMALLCIAGAIFAGSVLGYLSLNPRTLGSVSATPFLLARVAAAGVIVAGAALNVLSRSRRGQVLFVKGALLGAPVIAGAAMPFFPAGRRVIDAILGMGTTPTLVLGLAAALVLGGLLCASGHMVIHAFELGRVPDSDADAPPVNPG